ncbi:MAG: MlaD family protein [Bacteriovoracaceae bacterium]
MFRKPGDKNKVIVTGVFVGALSIIMCISVFFITKESALFAPKVQIKAKFSKVENLKPGAHVQLKGVKIGSVSDISFTSVEEITVTLGIIAKYSQWIKKDSFVSIRTQGILGDKFVEISGGTDATPSLKTSDFITTKEGSQLDQFIHKGEDILVVATRVLQKVDAILDPVKEENLNNIMSNMSSLTSNLNQSLEKFNNSNLEDAVKRFSEASSKVQKTSENLEKITTQIKEGPGSLHSLIYDPSIHQDLKAILGGARRNQVLKFFVREAIKSKE